MAKDYAKFVPPKPRRAKRKGSRPEIMLALVILLLGSVGVGYYVFQKSANLPAASQFNMWVAKISSSLTHHKNVLVKKNPVVVAQSNEPPAVRFDFYDQLQNIQVTAEEPVTVAQNTHPTPTPTPVVEASADAASVATDEPVIEAKAEKPVAKHLTPEEQISDPDAVSSLLEAEAKPAQVIKTTSEEYIIQLGSFDSESAAKRLVYALTSVGFSTQIVKLGQGSHRSYRVQQGPFSSMDVAKSNQQRLQKRGILGDIHKLT